MSDGTVRLKKPLAKAKVANDVSDVVEAIGGVRERVVVTEMHDEAPDEKRMDEIRTEIAEFGDGLLVKLLAGKLTFVQACGQLEARVLCLDMGHETTWEQREQLLSYARKVAAHLREELRQHKQVSGF